MDDLLLKIDTTYKKSCGQDELNFDSRPFQDTFKDIPYHRANRRLDFPLDFRFHYSFLQFEDHLFHEWISNEFMNEFSIIMQ